MKKGRHTKAFECLFFGNFSVLTLYSLFSGLQITAGQRTMSGLIADLTGQTPVLPVILTGHFWIQTLYFPYNCRLMLYNAAMISFFFGVFLLLCTKPFKEKQRRSKLILCRHVVIKRNKVNNKLSWKVTQCCKSYCTFCFAVISNVTFFGNSKEFLCFSGNKC